MKIKELKELIKNLDEDKNVELFNYCSEWYGVKNITSEDIKVISGNLVINIGFAWDSYEIEMYIEEVKVDNNITGQEGFSYKVSY